MIDSGNWPICAKCKKPVESLRRFERFETREIIVIAECHGETEIATIPSIVCLEFDLENDLKFETAFACKKVKQLC